MSSERLQGPPWRVRRRALSDAAIAFVGQRHPPRGAGGHRDDERGDLETSRDLLLKVASGLFVGGREILTTGSRPGTESLVHHCRRFDGPWPGQVPAAL